MGAMVTPGLTWCPPPGAVQPTSPSTQPATPQPACPGVQGCPVAVQPGCPGVQAGGAGKPGCPCGISCPPNALFVRPAKKNYIL